MPDLDLTIQIHDPVQGWLDAAWLRMQTDDAVEVEYEIDYGCQYLGRSDFYALSVTFPVQLEPYKGRLPGYLLDLIPQGPALRRLLARHDIKRDTNYRQILGQIPLAAPGNIRIKEPWIELEAQRPSYDHPGFSQQEIIDHREDFVQYMQDHGAPIGGTSGAGGGAPKFLLREDRHQRYHADGMLDDDKTARVTMVKLPFSDSSNSILLSKTEKAYYDLLAELPLRVGFPIEIHQDLLFIQRFDRMRRKDGRLHYLGLESLYSARGMSGFGMQLLHEENLLMIRDKCSDPQADAIEYLKRDLVNQALGNTDNHGRNTSLIKDRDHVALSPIYDVTAMKLFKGDFIVPLTRWKDQNSNLKARLDWVTTNLDLSRAQVSEAMGELKHSVAKLEELLDHHGVDDTVIQQTRSDRQDILAQLEEL